MVVETAVVLPVFLLLMFGFFQYSLAFTGYMNVVYASQMGARYAAMHSLSSASPATQAQVQAVVQSKMFVPGATSSGVIVDYGNRTGGSTSVGNYQGDLVGVGVYFYPNLAIPFFPNRSIVIVAQSYRVITR